MATNYGTAPIIADGLIHCWDPASQRSYPGSGTTLTDLVGNDNGTISNATFDANNYGSFYFDGADDIITFQTELDLGITQTISFWLKQNRPTSAESILGNSLANHYLFYKQSSGIYFRSGAGYWVFSNADTLTAFQVTDWLNISIVRIASNQTRFYINGILTSEGTRNITGGTNGNTLFKSIGAEPDLTFDFQGYISSFLIYNRTLSDAEILQNYNTLKGRFE